LAGEAELADACRQLWLIASFDLWEDWKDDRLEAPLNDFSTFTLLADDLERYQDEPLVRERIERHIRSNLRWVLGDGPLDAQLWEGTLSL
jgi:hypothetical protein